MKTIRERYNTDNDFHMLVDHMVSFITLARYTPSEMREAAILASIIYAERHVQQYPYELDRSLREIEKWVSQQENNDAKAYEERVMGKWVQPDKPFKGGLK